MQRLTINGAVHHRTRGVGTLRRNSERFCVVDFPTGRGVTVAAASLSPVTKTGPKKAVAR